jgi:hypothetical protein
MKLNEKAGLMSNKQNIHKEEGMKKSLALLWTMAATVGLLVVGCNKDTNGPEEETAPAGVTDEQSAMKVDAINDEFVKNDEQTFADQEVQPTDYGTFGKIDAAIIPLRWGRFITSVTRTVTITIQTGDTISIAHINKNIIGTLKIRGINGAGDTVLIEKPFNDKSDRNVMFKRVNRNPKKFWKNWIPVATSLVDGGTNTTSPQIDIMNVQMITRGGDTISISDPQNFYLRYRWLRHKNGNKDMAEFNSSDSVKVRVELTSASPDTDLVALRFGFNSLHKNRATMRLVRQAPGGLGFVKLFERTFYIHNRPGHFHAAIDAATKATLFDDDTTKYAVSWWGIPYRVF